MVQKLLSEGHHVVALYRNSNKINNKKLKGLDYIKGDILNPESLNKAMAGCDAVFHMAAFAKLWDKDPQSWFRINVSGTENVVEAAKKAGVKKFILTSTAGKYGPSLKGQVDETTQRAVPYLNAYEETKDLSEKKALEYADEAFQVVIVNPSRVYGPGLLSESNGVTRLVDMYVNGSYRVIPGNGQSIGNYVYVDDVVNGHVLALKNGKNGENYLLGGDNASFNAFFKILAEVSGIQRSMFHLPSWILKGAASTMEGWAAISGKAPLITSQWLKRFMYNWNVSSEKAKTELGYKPLTLEEGLMHTVKWLKKGNE